MNLEWKKTEEKTFNAGYRKMINRTFRLPSEKIANFDMNHDGRAVCILGITDQQKIILGKQFRPGPEKILLELPGGGAEDNETPEEAAKREFLEETGYSGDFKFVGTSLPAFSLFNFN